MRSLAAVELQHLGAVPGPRQHGLHRRAKARPRSYRATPLCRVSRPTSQMAAGVAGAAVSDNTATKKTPGLPPALCLPPPRGQRRRGGTSEIRTVARCVGPRLNVPTQML